MLTRISSEHLHREPGGECSARVRLVTGGPPVDINVNDNLGRSHLFGQISHEAAELLRRALNDVLGPVQDDRREKAKRDHELEVARAGRSIIDPG